MIDINISLFFQLLNFLVLYWLLDLILFKPLFRVMDERKARFAGLAEGFAAEKSEIGILESTYRAKLGGIHGEASKLRRKARDEAEAEKAKILENAEAKAVEMTQEKFKVVEQNLKELEQNLGKSSGELVEVLNRKVLGS
ncbi:ATP synthase F0 subunit B [bacterium]|jgi:F-type H+-transporting ATPase subunit b|nr:ATP synthase F0 subunit B [bacterium]